MSALFIPSAPQRDPYRAQAPGEIPASVATDIRTQNETIKFDIEKLFQITEALWTILKEQHGYTDEHLAQLIQDIDLRDGKLDGKVAKAAERPTCPQCGRVLIRNQVRCLYCNADVPLRPFER